MNTASIPQSNCTIVASRNELPSGWGIGHRHDRSHVVHVGRHWLVQYTHIERIQVVVFVALMTIILSKEYVPPWSTWALEGSKRHSWTSCSEPLDEGSSCCGPTTWDAERDMYIKQGNSTIVTTSSQHIGFSRVELEALVALCTVREGMESLAPLRGPDIDVGGAGREDVVLPAVIDATSGIGSNSRWNTRMRPCLPRCSMDRARTLGPGFPNTSRTRLEKHTPSMSMLSWYCLIVQSSLQERNVEPVRSTVKPRTNFLWAYTLQMVFWLGRSQIRTSPSQAPERKLTYMKNAYKTLLFGCCNIETYKTLWTCGCTPNAVGMSVQSPNEWLGEDLVELHCVQSSLVLEWQ